MEPNMQMTDEELQESGALVGAIDVGSNAIRLGVATRDADGMPTMVQRYREPVRLGHDAFTTGVLSKQTMDDAVAAFLRFRRILDKHHVERFRATATSAMRDSKNGQQLIDRIDQETGIKLELISGEEEARLVHYSISHRVDLRNQFILLIDMGGGSVEVTLCDDGEVTTSQSFNIGTVRLLEMVGQDGDVNILLSEYLDGTRKKIREQLGKRKATLCIATGGNAGAIGDLATDMLGADSCQQISRKTLHELIKKLTGFSFEARVRDLGLRPDRADVILPAAMVFHEIMSLAGAKRMEMPDASLLDGVILDMVDSEERTFQSKRRNLLAWTRSLKNKYHVDQKYSNHVAALSLSLFDQLVTIHGLGYRERMLLEIASLVHEIGMYVRVSAHHRHAAYLISASPLLGLNEQEKQLLSTVVRYHRKAAPSNSHAPFAALNKAEQQTVWQLSAILRMAIALNKERRSRVDDVEVMIEENDMTLHLEGHGDLLLERWAALKTADYIEQAFALQLHIDLDLTE